MSKHKVFTNNHIRHSSKLLASFVLRCGIWNSLNHRKRNVIYTCENEISQKTPFRIQDSGFLYFQHNMITNKQYILTKNIHDFQSSAHVQSDCAKNTKLSYSYRNDRKINLIHINKNIRNFTVHSLQCEQTGQISSTGARSPRGPRWHNNMTVYRDGSAGNGRRATDMPY